MKTKRAIKIPSYAAKLAKEILDIDTLETRNSDGLDFHEVSVWDIRDALKAAFESGRKAAAK